MDYLATRPDVDADRLDIVGICGWGGFGINTAQIDTRVRATAIITLRLPPAVFLRRFALPVSPWNHGPAT